MSGVGHTAGIIFSEPMVRALLAGRKTQTRRLATSPMRRRKAGDRLYVRETWSHSGHGVWTISDARRALDGRPLYRASDDGDAGVRWWPSIHMPREFSRLTLIVEDVKVEPLHAITLGDICSEGLADTIYDFHPVQRGFVAWQELWDSLHDKPGERLADNPHVVALTFRVEQRNIDKLEQSL